MREYSKEVTLFYIEMVERLGNQGKKRIDLLNTVISLIINKKTSLSKFIKQNTEFKNNKAITEELEKIILNSPKVAKEQFNEEWYMEVMLEIDKEANYETIKKEFDEDFEYYKEQNCIKDEILAKKMFTRGIMDNDSIELVFESRRKPKKYSEMSINALYCLVKASQDVDKYEEEIEEDEDDNDEQETDDLFTMLMGGGKEKLRIELEDLEHALINMETETLKMVLAGLKLDLEDYKKFEQINYSKNKDKSIIPKSMRSFCSCLNEDFIKGQPCEILGREKELNQLWDILLKREKRNAVLVGDAGVGKTAILEKLTWEIVNEKCPKQFLGFNVIVLETNGIISGTMYRGQAEERFQEVENFIKNNQNIILFIDEVHTVVGSGRTSDGGSGSFSDSLKPILASKNSRVIGATTNREYQEYFSKDLAFKRRFEIVNIKEPKTKDVPIILTNKINELKKYHEVEISDKMIRKCMFVARCFTLYNNDPDRTLDLIDRAMNKAKRLDKLEVDEESIKEVYSKNYNNYAEMDEFTKKRTAYHEMGHYIVSQAYNQKVHAVTIIPTDDYLGANILDMEDSENKIHDLEYYQNKISMLLAGRIGESLFTNNYSSGAASDLEKATKIAYNIIVKYGMGKKIGKNRIYIDNSIYSFNSVENLKMLDSQLINSINKEIDKIIKKCFRNAKKILIDKEYLLENLVTEIVSNPILSCEELENIKKK